MSEGMSGKLNEEVNRDCLPFVLNNKEIVVLLILYIDVVSMV